MAKFKAQCAVPKKIQNCISPYNRQNQKTEKIQQQQSTATAAITASEDDDGNDHDAKEW